MKIGKMLRILLLPVWEIFRILLFETIDLLFTYVDGEGSRKIGHILRTSQMYDPKYC